MAAVVKDLLPASVRAPLSRTYIAGRQHALRAAGRLLFAGHAVECPCCGSRFRRFAPLGVPDRRCWSCGSLERDRLIWLLLDLRPGMLHPGMRILHVAPDRALRERLASTPGVRYVGGDLDARYAAERIDVTSLDFADGSFDAVICNHVLEHVPDDRRALRELRRVLAPGGWAILLVPLVDRPATDEDATVTDAVERERRFGQRDHVRQYGRDYADRLREAGFRVGKEDIEQELGEERARRCRLRNPVCLEPLFVCR